MAEFKGWTLLKKVNSIFLICASFRVFPEYSSLGPRAACASYTLGPKQDKKVALETRFDWLNCSTKISLIQRHFLSRKYSLVYH